jgi:hypothetical protein
VLWAEVQKIAHWKARPAPRPKAQKPTLLLYLPAWPFGNLGHHPFRARSSAA